MIRVLEIFAAAITALFAPKGRLKLAAAKL
jgi:hypothetical protein